MRLLSVIICTHNPTVGNLQRCLDALRAQDLDSDAWELLVVDNASTPPIADRFDLGWHPRATVILENKLGVAHARMLGMRKARGDLIVFVDDDNLLSSNYLFQARRIAEECPWLGAWGGHIEGEYSEPPPSWAEPYLYGVAVRHIRHERWQNLPIPSAAIPVGAGMVVRREVIDLYVAICAKDPGHDQLGRCGDQMGAGEDIDLALTATDLGLGFGVFPRLRMRHIIPPARLTVDYLARLHEGIERSHHLLLYIRDHAYRPPRFSLIHALYEKWRLRNLPAPVRRIELARIRGREAARLAITRTATTK